MARGRWLQTKYLQASLGHYQSNHATGHDLCPGVLHDTHLEGSAVMMCMHTKEMLATFYFGRHWIYSCPDCSAASRSRPSSTSW